MFRTLRVLLAVWMFVATMLSSMTVVHAHAGGETAHHHHGHFAGECDHEQHVEDAHQASAVVFSSAGDTQWHAHVWLFGLEIHVPLPQDQHSLPCDAGLSAPPVAVPLSDATVDGAQHEVSQSPPQFLACTAVLEDATLHADWNHRSIAPHAPSGRQLRALIASLLL